MTRKEELITNLCDEIDYWKEEAERYKKLWERSNQIICEIDKNQKKANEQLMGICLESFLERVNKL